MAGEIIMSVAYGIDVLPVNDPYVALAEEAIKLTSSATVPGRFLVVSDTFQIQMNSLIGCRILFRS